MKRLTRERYFQKVGKKCINDGKHQPRHNVVLFRYVKYHKMPFRFLSRLNILFGWPFSTTRISTKRGGAGSFLWSKRLISHLGTTVAVENYGAPESL